MKTKGEIMEKERLSNSGSTVKTLTLEVLVDIRDSLTEINYNLSNISKK